MRKARQHDPSHTENGERVYGMRVVRRQRPTEMQQSVDEDEQPSFFIYTELTYNVDRRKCRDALSY
ncbi:hypothetical protein GCM10009067_34690 [Haloarcula sebkhae]|uniref:Uncharacterized protein n=1 Tax=Haloarcula sebkhae TaxID=932660 RepID=A0A830F2D0_9EURY|nr:hypothetical protein GCM10009067_34690 [Haloarcula sebkhae]